MKHAEPHRHNPYAITLDIRKSYPSIDTNRIYRNLEGGLYHALSTRAPAITEKEDKKLLIRALSHLCVGENELPQGAPTSPFIQNIVMRNIDISIEQEILNMHLVDPSYTRYGDDMSISFASFQTLPLLQKQISEIKQLLLK